MSGDNSTAVPTSQNNNINEKATEASATEAISSNISTPPTSRAKTMTSTKSRQTVQKAIASVHETGKESVLHPAYRIPSSPEPAKKKRTVLNALLGQYAGEIAPNLMEDLNDVEKGTSDNDIGSDDSDEDHDQDTEQYSQDSHDNDGHSGAHDKSLEHHQPYESLDEKTLASVLQSKSKSPINRTRILPDEPKIKERPSVRVREVSSDGVSDVPSAKLDILYSNIWLNFSEYLIKAVNILIPLFFIVHGILHIFTVGQTVPSTLGDVTDSIYSAAITMWSLVFAAIVGQTLKAYATWKAERGIKLQSLEQLLHSQSFSSAIKQPLLLRRVDFYSVSLFLLWVLSPLTNQAIQKMPTQFLSTQPYSMNISYIAVATTANKVPPQFYDNDVFEPIFGAALLAYTKKGPDTYQDGWQNPKVPLLSTKISDYGSTANTTWVDTAPWSTTTTWGGDYSSLIGIPTLINSTGFYEPGNISSIFFNASYFVFECTQPNISTPAVFNKTNSNGTPKFPDTGSTASKTLWLSYTDTSHDNDTGPTSGVFEWASVRNFNQLLHDNCSEYDSSGVVDCYTTYYPESNTEFIYSSCSVKAVGTENSMLCYDPFNCTIQAARIIPNAPFAYLPMSSEKIREFVQTYSGKLGSSTATISEAFVADPDDILQYLTKNVSVSVDLLNLDNTSFTWGVQTMWNTFYALYYANDVYLEGIETSELGMGYTNGQLLVDEWKYSIQPGWTALYFFSCVLLLALAIADIILETKTISPDFLGFASSVVRNNQRLNKQFKDSNLSGVQKTRAMGNMEVMIQDVKSTDSVGKVALAPSTASSVRLRANRKYGT